MKLRKVALNIHQFLGILIGTLLLIIGLTGSSLVFWHEINEYLNPHLFQVVPQSDRVSVQSIIEQVKTTYPDFKINYIQLPQQSNSVYEVGLTSPQDKYSYVYLNPYTGTILGQQEWGKTLMTFIYELHINFFAGEIGGKIVGLCGLALILLGITGLILWPGWKKLVAGFKIRWQSPRQLINYDIHKVGGVLSVAFLILIAATGAGMSFYAQFKDVIYLLTQIPEITAPKSTIIPSKPLPLDEIIQKASTVLPEGKISFINLPNAADEVVRVTKKLPQEISKDGTTRIHFDQYSGKLLLVENALKASLPQRILDGLFPLHIGSYGGLGMRIIYVLIGLTPAILSMTGLAIWQQRRWASARKKAAIQHSQKLKV